ncbi:MAG TPA: 20S proteasome subunit A/B [Verrucomicrobiae bacterium]|nr:20S proteasome subunit A/B [Verrucomicrobiae bacterium]
MIEEPYRWVEAIANRREYIEDQLRLGSPVVLLNYADGLLLLTVSRETRKIFEIYDRVAFSALGHPADIERMRLVAIDLAHIEGFNRAVADVSLRRLVNFGMAPALKTAFEQVFSAPYIVRMLLAEIGDEPEHDCILKLDYDGSFARSEIETKEPFDVLAGTSEAEKAMLDHLLERNGNPRRSLDDTLKLAVTAWAIGMDAAGQSQRPEGEPAEKREVDPGKVLKESLKTRHVEAAVLERGAPAVRRFRLLDEKEVRPALKDL